MAGHDGSFYDPEAMDEGKDKALKLKLKDAKLEKEKVGCVCAIISRRTSITSAAITCVLAIITSRMLILELTLDKTRTEHVL